MTANSREISLGFLLPCELCFRASFLTLQPPFSLAAAMAKNRNKKKRNGVVAMDMMEGPVSNLPQAMDTSESGAQNHAAVAPATKIKGRPMKRSKNVRKKKSIAKAIALTEKIAAKVSKTESKQLRTQAAKSLYD